MKKKIWFLTSFVIIMVGCGIAGCGSSTGTDDNQTAEKIKVEEGQSLVYGQIIAINGNEMTYIPTNEEGEALEEKGAFPNRGERPEGFDRENMPEGFDPENMPERPEGFDRENMPEGFDPENMPERPEGFDRENMPEGFDPENMPERPEGGDSGGRGNNIKEENITVTIPVGTKVTTSLGAETTFSHLATGDNIMMLVEEEEGVQTILEIRILE